MSRSRWTIAMLAVLSAAACSNNPTGGGSEAGTLTLRLTTPHADDGAVLFEVTGAPVEGAEAVDASLQLFTRRTDGSGIVGVMLGSVANGAVVTLRVADVGDAARYAARVLEVADRQNALRESLTGYALTVAP